MHVCVCAHACGAGGEGGKGLDVRRVFRPSTPQACVQPVHARLSFSQLPATNLPYDTYLAAHSLDCLHGQNALGPGHPHESGPQGLVQLCTRRISRPGSVRVISPYGELAVGRFHGSFLHMESWPVAVFSGPVSRAGPRPTTCPLYYGRGGLKKRRCVKSPPFMSKGVRS